MRGRLLRARERGRGRGPAQAGALGHEAASGGLRPHRQRDEGPRPRDRDGAGDPRDRRDARCRPRRARAVSDLRIRVPATSANLGPGFDSFGLALPMLEEFELRPARSWSVTVEGNGASGDVPMGADNLFVVAAMAAAKTLGHNLAPHHVTQRSAIPRGRGLGASAAAIVGGVVAANALAGEPLAKRALLRIASDVEGHADNVAAALYGAFTLALPSADGPIAMRFAFPSAWRVCLFVPTPVLRTEEARAVLPQEGSRRDAGFNLAHPSALLPAILQALRRLRPAGHRRTVRHADAVTDRITRSVAGHVGEGCDHVEDATAERDRLVADHHQRRRERVRSDPAVADHGHRRPGHPRGDRDRQPGAAPPRPLPSAPPVTAPSPTPPLT